MVRTSLNTKMLKKRKSSGEDRFSKLPDELISQILAHLSTKESVRTSVLSKRWENLWLAVPTLDLCSNQFKDDWGLLEFIDKSVESGLGEGLGLKRIRLNYDAEEHSHDDFVLRIDEVIKRKVVDLTIMNHLDAEESLVRMPLSLFSCEKLESLVLYCVVFDAPKSKSVVSLPLLKTMHLEAITFDGDWVLETLISNSPVLNDLTIVINPHDNFLEDIIVCSKSLRSFTLKSWDSDYENPDVEIDAPNLEYMSIGDYQCYNFIINNIGQFAMVDIDLVFGLDDDHDDDDADADADDDDDDDDDDQLETIHEFFTQISTVREMIISARTLEVIGGCSELETLPRFSNLSCLDVSFVESSLDLFPTFLGCFPNLQSLVLEFDFLPEEIQLSYVPTCFLSSLEIVQLKAPITETPSKHKLAAYFVRNCSVLKKLMVSETFDNIIDKIKRIPKRSKRCKIAMF